MLDPARLVFIDETAVSTNMERLRGRAECGVRLIGHAPSHSPSASVWHAMSFDVRIRKFRDFRFWVHIQKTRPPGNCRPVRGSFSPKSDRRSTRNAATSESAIRRGPTMKYPDGAGTYPRARNGREQKKAAVVRGTPGLPMPA